ncbi:MAG: hypothetical protein K2J54_05530, partial [Clostridia bacterium]|nr:hypothetical protein [Clostridia bacterium]
VLGIAYFFLYKYFLYRFEKHPEKQPHVREKKVKVAVAESSENFTESDEIAENLTLDEATRDNENKEE